MATITPRLFSKDVNTDIDEEQLLKLFWNRAELKKQLAALEKEMSSLEEQASQKDALMLRVQQRLNQLEALLTDPESAETAVTYYQLRGVWNNCNQALETLATELRRSHRDKAYQRFIANQEQQRSASVESIDSETASITEQCNELIAGIHALRIQRQSHRGIFGIFKRRSLTTEIDIKREQRNNHNQTLADLQQQKRDKLGLPVAEFDGLEVADKRRINLMVIACAQELVLLMQDSSVAQLALEATLSHVQDVSYGGKRACREIRHSIAERMQVFSSDTELNNRVKRRSRYLAGVVEYRNDQDAVPMAASLTCLTLLDENGGSYNQINVNVLADEYWNLFAVLLG